MLLFFFCFCFFLLLLLFSHEYSPRQGQRAYWGHDFVTTERPFLFAHMLQGLK